MASEAVFLIEVLDDDGEVSGVGSAFLVSEQHLITNYHVVEGGRPHLRIGPAQLECNIDKVDPQNDLALLAVQTRISAKPLILSEVEPSVGATVFTIGNPAGLERSISQGLVSGRREVDGRTLLQISAPISPGSSGGPVVNESGAVVGVAVGFLEAGQNLNFAVPARAVLDLLKPSPASSNLEILLQEAIRIDGELLALDIRDSEWSAKWTSMRSKLRQAKELAGSTPDKLVLVAETADRIGDGPIAIDAARAALSASTKPDLRLHRLLARRLAEGAWFLTGEERNQQLTEAWGHAKTVIDASVQHTSDDYSRLAYALEQLSKKPEAYKHYDRALAIARTDSEPDLRPYLRGLFRNSPDLKTATSWFEKISSNGGAEKYDWVLFAEMLFNEEDFQRAGDAWAKASGFESSSEYLCEAGRSYWMSEQVDEALYFYRRCVEVGALEEGSETRLSKAYSVMSDILFRRGVYDQAVSYAKQALALAPDEASAHYNLSLSLNALGRNLEAVAAAESAIRLTDGRYSAMHFALGAAHFDLKNWDRAALAFQKASDLDPKDPAAPYNVALCLVRQGFRHDAAKWFEEVLRRQPNHPDKEGILRQIRVWRE